MRTTKSDTPNIAELTSYVGHLQVGAHYVMLTTLDVNLPSGLFRIYGEFNPSEYDAFVKHPKRKGTQATHVICTRSKPHEAELFIPDAPPGQELMVLPAPIKIDFSKPQPVADRYSIGLLRSRLLSAIGDLENISASDCPSYYDILTSPCTHLKARIGDAVQAVCNQYTMPYHPITDHLEVVERDDGKGNGWLVVYLNNDPDKFEVVIPFEQLEHWFGAKS